MRPLTSRRTAPSRDLARVTRVGYSGTQPTTGTPVARNQRTESDHALHAPEVLPIWKAIVRPSATAAWPAPLVVGTTFEDGGQPDNVAVNAQGEAAVVFHGLTSDYWKNVLYTNTYHP